MGQLGFLDLNRRYEGLNEKNDVAIAAMVPFESFRAVDASQHVIGRDMVVEAEIIE